MKSVFLNLLFFIGLSISFLSCIRQPEFDDVPKILFNDALYYKGDDFDSLKISIYFEDGNGDLGIMSNETGPPFHTNNIFLASSGQRVPFSPGNLLNHDLYLDIQSDNDTMPAYDCEKYIKYPYQIVVEKDTITVYDTLYASKNPRRFNFYVNFFIKDKFNGTFSTYQFSDDCDATIIENFTPFVEDVNADKPVSGVLTRNVLIDFGFPEEIYLREEILKIQIYILDRSGNVSNTVESFEFSLKQIEVK